jgi:hypothetical protein
MRKGQCLEGKSTQSQCRKWSAFTAVWSALTPPKWTTGSKGHVWDPVDPKTDVIACLFTPGLRAPESSCRPQNLVKRQEHISLSRSILCSTQKSTDMILCGANVGHFQKFIALMLVPAWASRTFYRLRTLELNVAALVRAVATRGSSISGSN